MSKIVFFSLLAFLFFAPAARLDAQCQNLFISEYVEGLSNAKALEIFNPSQFPVDLSDYKMQRYPNGAATPGDTFFLEGILAPGDAYVIGDPFADTSLTNRCDTVHTITLFNGDDVIALFDISDSLNTDTLDIIGIIGVDPGTNWTVGAGATSEFTLIRKASISQGQLDWAIGATEWDVYPQNTLDSLGSHHIMSCNFVYLGVDIAICVGDSVLLDAGNPGAIYQWNTLDTTQTIYALAQNTYWVIVDLGQGQMLSDTITISYTQPVLANFGCDTLATPQVTFSDSSQNATTWFWTFGDGGFSTLQNPLPYTYSVDGFYLVTQIATNSCGSDTVSKMVNINTVDIHTDLASAGISIFPNPTAGRFVIDFRGAFVSTWESVHVMDMQGRLVAEQLVTATGVEVDLSGNAAGLYFVKVRGEGGVVNGKVLVR